MSTLHTQPGINSQKTQYWSIIGAPRSCHHHNKLIGVVLWGSTWTGHSGRDWGGLWFLHFEGTWAMLWHPYVTYLHWYVARYRWHKDDAPTTGTEHKHSQHCLVLLSVNSNLVNLLIMLTPHTALPHCLPSRNNKIQ